MLLYSDMENNKDNVIYKINSMLDESIQHIKKPGAQPGFFICNYNSAERYTITGVLTLIRSYIGFTIESGVLIHPCEPPLVL